MVLPFPRESGAISDDPSCVLPLAAPFLSTGLGSSLAVVVRFYDKAEEGERVSRHVKVPGWGCWVQVMPQGSTGWVDRSFVGPCPFNVLGLSPGWMSAAWGKDRTTLLGTPRSTEGLMGP